MPQQLPPEKAGARRNVPQFTGGGKWKGELVSGGGHGGLV